VVAPGLQAADLRTRIDAAQAAASTALADASDYDRIAAGFVDEAKMARDLADEYEQQARTWQQEADHLDTATDQVEDVLGADVRSEVHVITPTEDLEVDIPGRDPSTIPAAELHEKLPATAPQPTTADALTGDTGGGTELVGGVDVAASGATEPEPALSDVAATDLEIDPALIEIEPMEPVAAAEPTVAVAGDDAFAGDAMLASTEIPADIASVDSGPDDTTFDTA
jgi:hypothetical protein